MIAFLYGTSHHRELGGNDPFEAKYHCSRNLRLRQVVNWHKKKKSGVFLVSCRSLLSLFGCGFCCYSFFLGGDELFFSSLSISLGSFPPSHTQGWISPPDPLDFSFPTVDQRWFPAGNFFVVVVVVAFLVL